MRMKDIMRSEKEGVLGKHQMKDQLIVVASGEFIG